MHESKYNLLAQLHESRQDQSLSEDKFKVHAKRWGSYGQKRNARTNWHDVEAKDAREARSKMGHRSTIHGTINMSTPEGQERWKRQGEATYSTGGDPKNYRRISEAPYDTEKEKKPTSGKATGKKFDLKAFPALSKYLNAKTAKEQRVQESSGAAIRAGRSGASSMRLAHRLGKALSDVKGKIDRIEKSRDPQEVKRAKIARLNAQIASMRRKNTASSEVVGRQMSRIREEEMRTFAEFIGEALRRAVPGSGIFHVPINRPGAHNDYRTIKDYKANLTDAGIPFEQGQSHFENHTMFTVHKKHEKKASKIFYGR